MKMRATVACALSLSLLTACSGSLIGESTTVTELSTVGEVTVTATTTMTQLIGAGVVVTTTVAGPAAEQPVEAAEQPVEAAGAGGEIGAATPFDWDSDAAGTATVFTSEWRDTLGDESTILQTPDHGAYLVLDVAVESTAGTLSSNAMWWSASDAEGRKYDAEIAVIGLDPGLPSGDVAQDTKVGGFIAIDVPRAALTLNLSTPLGTPVASWTIAP